MGHESKNMRNNRLALIATLIILIVVFSLIFKVFTWDIFTHVIVSLLRMSVGYIAAIVLGVLGAMILKLHKYLSYAFKPLISFFIAIPTITWVPLLLIITGISEKTIVITIFLGSYFAILYNTLEGFENIDHNLIKVGKMLGYNKFQQLLRISLPASFNYILVGMKLGVAYSWRALVGAEMLGASSCGLGHLLFTSRKFYNLNKMVMTLMIIGLLGYILNRILISLIEEKTVSKWGLNK